MRTAAVTFGLAIVLSAVGLTHSPVNAQDANPPIANLNKEINVNGVEPDPFEPVNTNTATNGEIPVNTNTDAQADIANTNTLPQNINVGATSQNDNVNGASGTTPTRGNFRDPAHLAPLLLIPLAGTLYLVYEKIAKRHEE